MNTTDYPQQLVRERFRNTYYTRANMKDQLRALRYQQKTLLDVIEIILKTMSHDKRSRR